MQIATDDGVRLAVEVAGHGPGLVLVHGFGGAKEDLQWLIDKQPPGVNMERVEELFRSLK